MKADWAVRGIVGLGLVAMLAGCGSSDDAASSAASVRPTSPAEAFQSLTAADLPCEVRSNTETELDCGAGDGHSTVYFAEGSGPDAFAELAVKLGCRDLNFDVAYGANWIARVYENSLLNEAQLTKALGGQVGSFRSVCPEGLTPGELEAQAAASDAAAEQSAQASSEAASASAAAAERAISPGQLEVCLKLKDCRKRDLPGADFGGNDISGVSFEGANLAGADLSSSSGSGMNFDGANLSGALMVEVYFQDSTFRRANLSGADLTRGTIDDSDLSGADMTSATLPEGVFGLGSRNDYNKATCPDGRAASATDGC